MQDSIFTKIIKGEIPSYKIYEDERVYAFLDIHPVTPGHVLVIPKIQIEFVWDLDDADYLAVMKVAKLIATHLRSTLGVRYIGEKVVGVDVPHAHVQLIPFNDSAEFQRHVDQSEAPDFGALALIAKKLQM